MPLTVVCEYPDRHRKTVRQDFAELAEAVTFALILASNTRSAATNGLADAEFVHVMEDTRTELTVRVFRDGN